MKYEWDSIDHKCRKILNFNPIRAWLFWGVGGVTEREGSGGGAESAPARNFINTLSRNYDKTWHNYKLMLLATNYAMTST